MYDILELSEMLVPELREIAKQLEIKRAELLKKQDLIYKILDQQAANPTQDDLAAEKKQRKVRQLSERGEAVGRISMPKRNVCSRRPR